MYRLLSSLYISFATALSTEKIFIRNKCLPICANCIHFIEHTNNYPYDPLPDDRFYGKCKKYGELDLISGVINHDFAKHCRMDNTKCGKMGTDFKEKTANNIVVEQNRNRIEL
jgi:hypothetical protein